MSRSESRALLLVAAFAVSAAAPVRAASAEPEAARVRAMTLREAVAYARAHQPAIRAALARVRAQQEEAKVPRSQWLPLAGVTAQIFGGTANNTTGGYLTPSFMDIPRIGGTRGVSSGTLRPYASTFVGGSITQEAFDFGRIAAQSAAADAVADVERARQRGAILDVTYAVEEAYFAVFAAKAIVKASDDAYERARVHRDLAKAGVDAGLRPPIELTRAEADLAKLDIGRLRARGGLAAAEDVFAAAVGVSEPALDVADAPPKPEELPALAAAITAAEARDPRLLEALAALRAQEAKTRAIGAELRPDLSLTATVSGRAGGAPPSGNGEPANGDGFIPNVPNWDVGLVLAWPLFDGTVSAREGAARAEEDARREEIAEARHEEIAAVRAAYAAVEIARGVLPGLARAVDAARANYTQADARFRAGLGTSVEIADAEAVREDAEIQLALGQFELARARSAFGRAIAEGASP